MTTTAKPHTTPAPEHMTGADLQTLREACALSRDDLADLAGVQARTVKHWENGRAGVPADVAALVLGLDAALDACTGAEFDAIHATWEPGTVPVLLRFKTAQELREHIHATQPAHQRRGHDAGALWRGVPFCAAGAVALRVAILWRFYRQQSGGTVQAMQLPRVVWFDVASYTQWQAVHNTPDSETARTAWARAALGVQAIPHRGDQPPA